MNTQDFEVIDRQGKRVRRQGILQSGDTLVVKMNMMDGAAPALAALASAAALADAIKRVEQFDARGHRPGFLLTQDASADGGTARDQYHARNRDAWRNPPVLVVTTDHKPEAPTVRPTGSNNAEARKAADAVIANRDKRMSEAWRNNA